jgi:hypothetical protein
MSKQKKDDLTYEQMRALERKAKAKHPPAKKPKAKPVVDWRTIVGADDR